MVALDADRGVDAVVPGSHRRHRALEDVVHAELRPLHVDGARVAQKIRHETIEAPGLFIEDAEQRRVVLARDGILAQARDRVGDDRQRVADLVGDDRGELAHHRQLLLLGERLLRDGELFADPNGLRRESLERLLLPREILARPSGAHAPRERHHQRTREDPEKKPGEHRHLLSLARREPWLSA